MLQKENWSGRINVVTIGATKEEGGSRGSTVKIGGESTLPFLHFEGEIPHRPVVAMEVFDVAIDLPEELAQYYHDVLGKPGDMAKRCVEEFGAELIALSLVGTEPDKGDRSPEEACAVVREVLEAVSVPLMINGPSNFEKSNQVMVKVAQEAAGENCLLGVAETDNYKSLAAACLAYGHSILALTPIDINMAKQLNILISNLGVPKNKIVMDPMTGALGYGLEYTYSVMERIRLAALQGDEMMQMPMSSTTGHEAWRHKEAKAPNPLWGDEKLRGPLWEATTAQALLMAGVDIVIMRHPEAVKSVKSTIQRLIE